MAIRIVEFDPAHCAGASAPRAGPGERDAVIKDLLLTRLTTVILADGQSAADPPVMPTPPVARAARLVAIAVALRAGIVRLSRRVCGLPRFLLRVR